jgi:eukaryotic-like serine/threonine-protein kinase
MSASTDSGHDEGWKVPGYTEERELGHGASGRVVEAVQEGTGRRVAIKYLSSDLARDPDFVARFRPQVLRLRDLDIPQLVRVYDFAGQPGQHAAVVMELVSGASLGAMIEHQGPLRPEAALAVLKGALLGLAAVHRLGFGHRDVKPGNVLVDTNGQVKLTDIGLATRPAEEVAAGTPQYQAPERWDGEPASPATDVYAATAVFFECLTGAPPFSGDLAQLQELHATAAVPLDQTDEPLQPLILAGLAKERASRPHSANAFVSELEALAAGAYGADWEELGRGQLADRTRAVRPLLRRRQVPPPSAGSPAADRGEDGGRRRKLVIMASIAAAVVIALGAVATAVTLTSGGHKASLSGSSSRVAAALTPSFKAVANVTPPVAASKCATPTAFTYSATLSATAPGTAEYQWVYSSGQPGPVQTVTFTGAGDRIETGKTVKAKTAGGGWAEIRMLSPVGQTSAKASYKLLCGASGGGITAATSVQPSARTASCVTAPPAFTASGWITAAKAETVTYYWAQSNGKDSAPATLTFTGPATLAAKSLSIVPPPATGSGEAVLVVTSPVLAASSPATYTLLCAAPQNRATGKTSTITSLALSATASVSPASQSLTSCSAAPPTFTFSGTISSSEAGAVSYYWQLPSGSGPAQTLSFSRAGTQKVTAAYTPANDSASGSGVLVITSPGAVSSNAAAYTLACGQGLGITNDAPTIARVGAAYSGTVTVSGGTGPYGWSVTGLPNGLTANGNGAVLTISGDPQVAGTFTAAVSVHDSGTSQLTGTTSLAITVNGVPEPQLAISGRLRAATVGKAYSASITGTGGNGSYTWTVTGLPSGLTSTSKGRTLTISGTPAVSGSFPVAVTVSDSESPAQTAAGGLTLVVSGGAAGGTGTGGTGGSGTPGGGSGGGSTGGTGGGSGGGAGSSSPSAAASAPALEVTTTALPSGTAGDAYAASAVATGGDGTYSWSASGLPSGLTIDPLTGTISGTPTASGTFTVDLSVSDGSSGPDGQSGGISLTINPGAAPDPGPSA